jgi:DnaB-like helicase C terminal domain/Primase C terminal 1 (PriCT-1)
VRYPEYRYVGHKVNLDDPTKITTVDRIPNYTGVEAYVSPYRFDESVKELVSLASLPHGTKFMADHLLFDLDSKDLPKAHEEMQKLCQEFEAASIGFLVYFSGGKGFHVLVPSGQFEFAPTEDDGVLSRMAHSITDELGITTWDSSVYNKTRVLRAVGSKHPKTGLHKIKIDWRANLADIQTAAKRNIHNGTPEPTWESNDVLCQVYEKAKVRVIRDMAPHLTNSITGVLSNLVPEGQRNDSAYRMAQYLARRAITEADARFILRNWNAQQVVPPLQDDELSRTITSAYAKGINTLQDESDIKVHVHDIHAAIESSRKSLLSVGGGIKTGYDDLDAFTMGFQPQDVIIHIARTKTYKTALASAFCQRISTRQNKAALFFSMEMPVHSLNYRHLQYGEEMSRKEVYDAIKAGHEFPKTREAFKHVHIVGLSNLTTQRVVRLLDHYLEQHGDLSFVVFDYLSLFQGCANDSKATAKQITELKTVVAKMLPCPLMVLTQARRELEGDEQGDSPEVTLDGGKDSGYIEDTGDYIFGAWSFLQKDKGKTQKFIFERALKARAYDSLLYKVENPYFVLDINPETMNVQNIVHDPNPPKFARRKAKAQ